MLNVHVSDIILCSRCSSKPTGQVFGQMIALLSVLVQAEAQNTSVMSRVTVFSPCRPMSETLRLRNRRTLNQSAESPADSMTLDYWLLPLNVEWIIITISPSSADSSAAVTFVFSGSTISYSTSSLATSRSAGTFLRSLLSMDPSNFQRCLKYLVFEIFKCSKVCAGRKTRRPLWPEHLAKLCHPHISGSHGWRSLVGHYINDRNSCVTHWHTGML